MMMPQYSHAPITEAIIDVRIQARAELKLGALARMRVEDDNAVARQESMILARGQFEVRPNLQASVSTTSEKQGFKFTSEDGRQICQVDLSGFTMSRLAPYQGWEAFRSEAQRLWNRYRHIAIPEAVTRLAVRYINRIDIPGDTVEMKDFFRTSPEVSPLLPQTIAGFFLQIRLPQDDIEGMLVLNQTIVPSARAGVISVVLDQDLFCTENLPQDESEIWELFETLHARKNEVFEACITDRTRELIA